MKLERPPFRLKDLHSDLDRVTRGFHLFGKVPQITNGKYLPWHEIRHRARQVGADPIDAWCAIKLQRYAAKRDLELVQPDGQPFSLNLEGELQEPLHRIDRATGGGGPAALNSDRGVLTDEYHRARMRIRSLMHEAAESSIMEGAATTRKIAVDMLRSDRKPATHGERMIANNYAAMQRIKHWLDRPLSVQMLLELQATLTNGTLEPKDQDAGGRLRRLDEPIRVEGFATGEVIHVPPSAELLPHRLAALCEFANAAHEGRRFLHPIVKASILHFMIGYEHPFVDGNGRTARAVFYWYALRNGYDVFEYMPISDRIRLGTSRYPQAYIDTELDDGDLTYFVLYKLDIIEQALEGFAERLRHEEAKIKRSEQLLRLSNSLNLRQRLLIEHALRHPQTLYTVSSHENSNGIVKATARADLEGLAKKRLLVTAMRGRERVYQLAPGVPARLARKGL